MGITNEASEAARRSETVKVMKEESGDIQSTPSRRRVLGDVSPNVKVAASTPAFMKRAMAGSPLKRSFTAAMEGGDGFKYLKRRKLDANEALSDLVGSSLGGALEHTDTVQAESVDPQEQSATPTEPNTPSEENEDNSSGSSAERKSFSSLINYDPSSQSSNLLFKTTSHAETLRLRLRVAMYKVQTNQVGVPFTDLHIEDQSPAAKAQRAADAAVEELRREAREVAARGPRQPVPKLMAAPVLRPTAYSSRFIYATQLQEPPSSPGELPVVGKVEVETPGREMQRLQRPFEAELTSSAVKGRAAEELLGLRHAI